jgi:D-tyrosyl-tRNA(Tyr) deacylase
MRADGRRIMRVLVQRVSQAAVVVENRVLGEIGPGLVLLIGIREGDDEVAASHLAQKVVNLRIFEDDAGKLNRSALDLKAHLLAVSQFTLYADCRKGRRPSFITAARPDISLPLYKKFVHFLQDTGLLVKEGEFGAHMVVKIYNDGPVTILLDSDDK